MKGLDEVFQHAKAGHVVFDGNGTRYTIESIARAGVAGQIADSIEIAVGSGTRRIPAKDFKNYKLQPLTYEAALDDLDQRFSDLEEQVRGLSGEEKSKAIDAIIERLAKRKTRLEELAKV